MKRSAIRGLLARTSPDSVSLHPGYMLRFNQPLARGDGIARDHAHRHRRLTIFGRSRHVVEAVIARLARKSGQHLDMLTDLRDRKNPMKREAASFINLDLELNSAASLSRLARHLEGTAFVLFNGRVQETHRLCAEPLIDGRLSKSLRACTAHFLDTLETLPTELAELFKRTKSRVFDYGFEGGLESKPLSVNISSAHLARISRLGLQVRITVYPHRGAMTRDT